jgi:hypothetical protein
MALKERKVPPSPNKLAYQSSRCVQLNIEAIEQHIQRADTAEEQMKVIKRIRGAHGGLGIKRELR